LTQGDATIEIQKLEEHLNRHPDSERFAELASAYLSVGRARDALRVCEKGMGFHPTLAAGHINYGKALVELQQLEEGIRAFERACALAPSDPGVWTEIAAFLKERGQVDSARPYLDRALVLAPSDPRVLNLVSDRTGADASEVVEGSFEVADNAQEVLEPPMESDPAKSGFGEWQDPQSKLPESENPLGYSLQDDEPEPPTLYVTNPLVDGGSRPVESIPVSAPTIADPVPEGSPAVRSGPRATEPPTIYSPESAPAPWASQEPEVQSMEPKEPPTRFEGGHPTVAAPGHLPPPTMLASSSPAVTVETRPPVVASGSFSYYKVFLVLVPFLVVGLGLGIWVALRHIRADRIADLLEQARASMALDTLAGYNDARTALDELLDLDSESKPARSLKALLLARLGDEYGPNQSSSDEARQLLSALNPVEADPAPLLAARLHLGENPAELRKAAESFLASKADDAPLLSLVGEIDLRLAQLDSARKMFQDALKRDGGQVRTLYLLGELERRANHAEQAVDTFQRALTVNGLHVGTLIALSDIRLAQGRELEPARADLAKVLELPQVTDRQKAEAHLRLAHLAFLTLDRPRALTSVRASHELLPDDPLFQQRLLRLCLDFFELDEVASRVEKMLPADPDSIELNFAAVENSLWRGKAQQALQGLVRLVGKKVPAARLYLLRGEALRQVGKLDSALEEFELLKPEDKDFYVAGRAFAVAARIQKDDLEGARRQALTLEKEFPQAGLSQWALGIVALARGNERAAATAFAEAIRRDGRCYPALVGLAELALAHGKFDEAQGLLARALTIQPFDSKGRLRLGQVELRRKNPVEAEQAFARLLLDQPNHAEALVGLAEALLLQGQLDKAERSIRMARKAGAQDANARHVEGRILLASGRFLPAVRVLKEADEKDPRNPDILADLGLALLGARNLNQAEKVLRQSLARKRQLRIQEGLAEVLALRGQHAAAAAAWEKAAQMAQREKLPPKESVRLYLSGGRAWIRQGTSSANLAQARRLFSAAAKLDPSDPAPVFELAAAWDRDDKLERARVQYEKVLTLVPDHAEALFRLGLLEFEQHHDARAKELLEKYLSTGAKGANAKRARDVLKRIR